jgi:CheY-like chemotaxis protein
LVVDDDPAARRLLEPIITRLGRRAVCVASAEEGLEVARTDPPILVVLDLCMPTVDGFAFLARFRQLRVGYRTPIVVWTAKDLSPSEEERLRGAASAVIAKGSAAPSTLIEQLRPLVTRLPDSGETTHEA